MEVVAIAMRMMDERIALLRPIVSPMCPKISPPIGLMKNAPAKMLKVDIVAVVHEWTAGW